MTVVKYNFTGLVELTVAPHKYFSFRTASRIGYCQVSCYNRAPLTGLRNSHNDDFYADFAKNIYFLGSFQMYHEILDSQIDLACRATFTFLHLWSKLSHIKFLERWSMKFRLELV